MIPTGVTDVASFVFFVAPGLLWQFLVERRRPAIKESGFREASRIALASIPFSLLGTTAVIGIADAVNKGWLAQLSRDFGNQSTNSGRDLLVLSLFAAAELAAAALLVMIAWLSIGVAIYGTAVVRRESAWTYALGAEKGEHVFASVYLDGDYVVRGRVFSFTADLEMADRELTLGQPMTFQRGHDQPIVPMTEQLLVIPETSIRSLGSVRSISKARSSGPSDESSPPAPRALPATVAECRASSQEELRIWGRRLVR